MELKNSVSILLTNNKVTYRVLLYLFINLSILLAFGTSIVIPALNKIFSSTEGLEMWEGMKSGILNFLNGEATVDELYNMAVGSYSRLMELVRTANFPATFWTTIVIMYILSRFVMGTSYPIICDIYHNFMSSNMEYGFLSNLFKNLRRCVRYSAAYTLVTVPIDALILFSTFGIVTALFPSISVFALTIGLLWAAVLVSLRIALFAGALPEMTLRNETENFFKALKKSWPLVKKYFKDFSMSVSFALFIFYCAIAVTAPITFGISFFVLAPMAICFVHVLELVYFYGANSMRYYTDASTIVNTAPLIDRIDLQEELLNKDK